ncbi:YHS domain-containing protein [Burkholderia diffusa]|nr:YHS domain-containing protein [Burkholderia diffusa]
MGGHRRAPHEPGSRQDGPTNGAAPHLDGSPRDPVNGQPVDQAHALTSIFDGQTYYFESEQSREEFNRDPQRFAHGGTHRHHGGC